MRKKGVEKMYRKGIFFVVYKKNKGKLTYLLLHRKLHWTGWEFPKAGLKNKEAREKAVIRELKEETGCKPKQIIHFNITGKYKYKKSIPDRKQWRGQTYILSAVEISCTKIKLDKKEHDNHKWVSFNQAIKLLTWPNQRKCLRIVEKKLN